MFSSTQSVNFGYLRRQRVSHAARCPAPRRDCVARTANVAPAGSRRRPYVADSRGNCAGSRRANAQLYRTATTRIAKDLSASADWGRPPQAPSWPTSGMPASRTGARLLHGWDWCRDKILQATRPGYWVSASTVMSICARCSFVERTQCFDISSTEPIDPMTGCGVCWPDVTKI